MRIDGLFEVKQAHRRVARPYQISVKIGVPISFPTGTDPQAIPAILEREVASL
jgi:hypothetical protein